MVVKGYNDFITITRFRRGLLHNNGSKVVIRRCYGVNVATQ